MKEPGTRYTSTQAIQASAPVENSSQKDFEAQIDEPVKCPVDASERNESAIEKIIRSFCS